MLAENEGAIVAAILSQMTCTHIDELTGKTTDHLAVAGPYAGILHAAVVEPFQALKASAADAGFDLRIISGFRSFYRQLAIWNGKASGDRPLLDEHSNSLNPADLTSIEIVHAILRWSALPGASRHHWGTDFDIYDASAVAADYQVQLVPAETQAGGPFASMHNWLDEELPKTDFYRPYAEDRGGIAPERWHLSYAPIADPYAHELTTATILSALDGVEIALRDCITEHIGEIFQRYVIQARN